MTAPGKTLDRAFGDVGELIARHDRGLSFDDLTRYGGRFAAFCEEVLDLQLTPQQREAADVLERGDRQVLLVGGNGLGKDLLGLGAWPIYAAYVLDALVLLTGPVERTVREAIMRRSVGWLWRQSGLPGELFEMALRLPNRPRSGILAFTATDPERVVSHHAPRLVVGVTEGQGVDPEIFEALQRLQPHQLLVTANPTSPATAVYGFSRSNAWTALGWSCLDHPNVQAGETRIPGAVTKEWVDAMRQEHGEGSRFWTVSVLGIFPEEAESALFPAIRWDEAMERGEEAIEDVERSHPNVVVGVDVSRGGEDATAAVVRRGPVLWNLHRWHEPDTQVNAERIRELCRTLLEEDKVGIDAVVIDEVGDGGGVFDKFRRLARTLSWTEVVGAGGVRPRLRERRPQAVGFKGSRSAPRRERFANVRAQAFHRLGVEFEEGRTAIRPGIEPTLLSDLREELLSHQRIHQADDRILMGAKDEIRKALGRSPDLADAYSMTFEPVLESDNRRKIRFV